MPAPQASGPCAIVIAGTELFVVDAGTDGIRNLIRMGYQPGSIAAVFLTHFHSDHIDGLGELSTQRWAGGANTSPLPVYGPEGVEKVVKGFNAAYSNDARYRHEHHGNQVAPTTGAGMTARQFLAPEKGQLRVVYRSEHLTIEAFSVDHRPVVPAVGYRFSYKDRSLLISGDTAKSGNVERFSKGVDILVHDALAPNLISMMNRVAGVSGNPILKKITEDIPSYHASPFEAATIARNAGVGHLLYYHIVPPLVLPGQESLFLDGAESVFEDFTIGRDGVSFSLPANSSDIVKTSSGL